MSQAQIVLKSELANALAVKYGMEVNSLMEVLSNTIIPNKKASKEHVVTLLVVAQQYDLNPFVKEIQAFPNSSGGITPMVGIEGWTAIVNRHPAFDGCELNETFDEKGVLDFVECVMYRKDRGHPIKVREYYQECKRNTAPWTQWPIRMLRHKAYIQCARLAFSLSGIYDIDEIERMQELGVVQRVGQTSGIKVVNLDALPEPVTAVTTSTQVPLGEESSRRLNEMEALIADEIKNKKRRGRPPKEEKKEQSGEPIETPVGTMEIVDQHVVDPETEAARQRIKEAKSLLSEE
jgi:phage recombination protein Bet